MLSRRGRASAQVCNRSAGMNEEQRTQASAEAHHRSEPASGRIAMTVRVIFPEKYIENKEQSERM